jgi:tetratricopeptide (TPR) repeat protein
MKLIRQSNNTNIIILSIFIFNLALVHNVNSQDAERYLQINGTAELNMKPVSNAVVTLYEENSKVNSVKTGSSGRFSFKLDMNKDYTVEVSKEGYVSKRIRFITNIPDEVTGIWVREFAVGLVKYCEGVNYSVLKDPVDVIKYSVRRQDFDSDKTFVYKVKPRLENLYIDVDQCLIEKYNNTLDEADKLMNDKKYDEAREKYEQAMEMFPDEAYPDEQIGKINDMIYRDKNIENLYNRTLNEADALFAQKRYDEALLKYKGALKLKPQETHLNQKISEIESLKAEQDAELQAKNEADANYNLLISKGNTALAMKNYEMAKQYFSQALEIKPGNYYPSNKLQELEVLIAQKAQNEAEKQEIVKEYNNAVSRADQLFMAKNYEEAKASYEKALLVNPQESYPREKIAEIENMIKEQQEALVKAKRDALEGEYEAALAEGDNYYKLKDYEAAKVAYSKAASIKPDEFYPKQRLERINKILEDEQEQEQQALEKSYNDAIAAGENFMGDKQYELAKQEFNKALGYKPDDIYARNKISEIDRLIDIQKQRLAEDRTRDEQYRAAIIKADGFFKMKEFDAAKIAYQDALGIKPGEQYPRAQIQEIERLLAIREAEKQREMEVGYKSAILSGNRLFSGNQYALAKSEFEKALNYKPGDTYASSRISEIDRILSEQEQKAAAYQARKKQYDELIARADGLKNLKEYVDAKNEYNRALQIMPEENYPRQQIAEIDRIIAEQERALAEKKARENNYAMAISKADGFFRLQEYEKAKAEYNNALTIMPDEIYPKNKISEIDNIIAAQLKAQADAKALNDAYDNAVRQADNLFSQEKYAEAKSSYTTALNYKPGSDYPKEQISRIDIILARQERIRQEEMARDKEYESLILTADNLYNAADYNNAKENYQKALEVKPDELYPKQRIARINDIIKQLAKQQTTAQSYKSQSSTQTGPRPKLTDLVFKDDRERDRYLDDLKKKYPEGVTLETYKERLKTTRRYIIIRNNEAHEFRMVHFTNWGGKEYSVDGKPITGQYFESQTSPRSGEYYKEFEF